MTSLFELTTMQDKFASAIDHTQVCSFQMEFVDKPTFPIIHSSARFLFFTEGACVFTLNGVDYNISANTIIAILPWDISVIKSVSEPLTFQKIVYNSNFINGYLRDLYNPKNELLKLNDPIINCPVLKCNQQQTQHFQNYILQLQMELGDESANPDHSHMPELSDILIVSTLISMLVLFNRYIPKETNIVEAHDSELELTTEIMRYISSNLQSKLTLEKLSKIFSINESAMAQYFQKNVGYTFSEIITEMRLDKSYDLLLYSDLCLTTIAQIIGFNDASHFIKTFNTKVGCSPNEYRKTYKNKAPILKGKESEVIFKVLNYIQDNYLYDKISGAMVAKKFGISLQELNHIMVFQVEKSFDDYVDFLRISKACELLITTDLAITDIAIDVGYNTSKTFTRIFSNIKQMTPGVFRKNVCLQLMDDELIFTFKKETI